MNTIRNKIILCLALLGICTSSFAQQEGLVDINMRNVDIQSFIDVAADITGETYILDPRVSGQGQVTIISDEPISASMFYQAFLSTLQVNQLQAIPDGDVIRIVPFNQAFGFLGTGGGNELETRLIKVNNVDAQSLVPVVKPLLSQASRLQAFTPSNYLVVTDISSNVQELVGYVEELDDPSEALLEIVELENITAGEAAHIVSELGLQQQGLTVVEDTLRNRLIISGRSGARATFKNMLRSLDVPTTDRAGRTEVIYLDFARAEDIKPILDSMLESFLLVAGESEDSEEASAYRVEVAADANALVVAASPDVIREMRSVIDQLDEARPQVLIEAVIAELSEDQARRLSTQLIYADQESGGYLTRFDNILTTILGTAADGDFSDSDTTALNQALSDTSGGMVIGGDFDAENGTGFGLLVQALKTDSRTEVLSTPSLVTLDNSEALISVGEDVPFLTGSVGTGTNGIVNPFQTIERENVGIELVVTPNISKGDAVRLQIVQTSSKLQNNASQRGTVDVVTSESRIETNVMVQDSELLVLGGLISDQFDDTQSKVPLLGDIPVLGHLFRSSSKSNGGQYLMMFIRPTILRDAETANALSRDRFNYLMRVDQEESEESGVVQERLEEFLNESPIAPAAPIE